MLVGTGQRRTPNQARSRERQDRILQHAEVLIAAHGSEAMRMAELAAASGISIGSLYQYYRDKGAVLAALALRYHADSTTCIEAELSTASSPASLLKAFHRLMDIYAELFRSQPVMRDVWMAIQADRELRAIELEASKRNGDLLAAAVRRCGGGPEGRVETACFTIMALGEATMRLAVSLPPAEADAMVASFTNMAVAMLKELTGSR